MHKANFNNKAVIKVNKYYPSSKLCHICGYKKIDLTLKDRSWTCPICNTTHNRDYNASINILNEGLRSLSLGTNDYTDGVTYNSSMMVSEPI
ncbi:MAG: transposase, partial [Firmicutes bacterium]|nr:transposase [Candidatus Colivicinus equi]